MPSKGYGGLPSISLVSSSAILRAINLAIREFSSGSIEGRLISL